METECPRCGLCHHRREDYNAIDICLHTAIRELNKYKERCKYQALLLFERDKTIKELKEKKTEVNVYSHFKRKPLSKMWPSTDPNDIPYDEFTCNFCGKKLVLQSLGAAYRVASFEERIAEVLLHHLKYECDNDLYTM